MTCLTTIGGDRCIPGRTRGSGGRLPEGARAALMNEWLIAGSPMGEFDTWVKSVVYPGMLYGSEQ